MTRLDVRNQILHVVSELHPRMGGSIRAALQIADCVQGDGYACTVVGTAVPGRGGDKGVEQFRAEYPRLRLVSLPNHFPRHSFASKALRRWLERHAGEYDVVHSHGLFNFPYLYAARAARLAGVPLIVSPHNSLDPYDLRKKRILKKIWFGPVHVRPILEYASRLLCTAEREAADAESYGAQIARTVIPLPVPEPPSAAVPADNDARQLFRTTHQLPPDARVALYVSRLDRKKGLELVLRAVAELQPEIPDLYLCIAGGGNDTYERELRRFSNILNVSDRVRWLGFLSGEEKSHAYRCADIFVLTSYNENFGIVLAEALYHGLPLLTSDQVYIADALRDAGVAEVCPPDASAVTATLRYALHNGDWRARVAAEGRSIAHRLFGPAHLSGSYRELYESVVRSRSPLKGQPVRADGQLC